MLCINFFRSIVMNFIKFYQCYSYDIMKLKKALTSFWDKNIRINSRIIWLVAWWAMTGNPLCTHQNWTGILPLRVHVTMQHDYERANVPHQNMFSDWEDLRRIWPRRRSFPFLQCWASLVQLITAVKDVCSCIICTPTVCLRDAFSIWF